MDRHPVSRRQQRSRRITVAVVVLAAATVLVAAALWAGDVRLVAGSGLVALLSGYVALRLAWTVIIQARFQHAVDRTELSRTYRQLFAERAVEHHVFVETMTGRVLERDHLIRDLEVHLVDTHRRAVVAETTVKRSQRRLAEAEGRIVTLEDYLARSQAEHRTATTALSAVRAELDAVREAARPRPVVEPVSVVPDWADLETDPTAALMAWEEHAQQISRQDPPGARHAREA